MILQQNPEQAVEGVFDVPDDALLGGTFRFEFHAPVELGSIDLIDICPGQLIQDAFLVLFDLSGEMRVYFAPGGWTEDVLAHGPPGFGTLDLTTLDDQPGFSTTAVASETPGFDPKSVMRLDIQLSSSGAVDNLVYDPHPDTR